MTHALVVRLDNDGDVLLAGPAIRAVAGGSERVTLLHGPRGARGAGLLPGVDGRIEFLAPWIDPVPPPVERAAVDRLVTAVRHLHADRALIFGSFHQSPLPTALLLRLAGVPFVAAISDDYPGSLLDVRHRVDDDLHEVTRALSLAAAAGYRLPDGDERLRVCRPHGPPPVPGPYVVVHPGASVPARAWPAARHAELVAALAADGLQVVVTGGPDETSLTELVAGRRGRGTEGGAHHPLVHNLGGATTLAQLADVLAGATAVVVGNTGPAHLAAAVATPVVSLFAPTVPAVRWRPWRVPHELLHVEVACAGCRARACPVTGHPCLAGVAVADVRAALGRILEQQKKQDEEDGPAPAGVGGEECSTRFTEVTG